VVTKHDDTGFLGVLQMFFYSFATGSPSSVGRSTRTLLFVWMRFIIHVHRFGGPPLKFFTRGKIWVHFTQLPTLIANSAMSQDIQHRKDKWSIAIPSVFGEWSRLNLVHCPESNTCEFGPTQTVVELRGGPMGPGPPERPGGPIETSGLRGYKGAKGPLKGPLEITRQIQYMIAIYQYHSKHRWWCTVPSYMIDKPCSIFD